MKLESSNMFVIVLSITFLFLLNLELSVAKVGVCFGTSAVYLPSKPDVVALYKKNNITKMRIYNTEFEILEALGGSNIEVTVAVLNEDVQKIGSSQFEANNWVQNNIKSYPNVCFRYIVVGNGDIDELYSPFLLKAMENLYHAICTFGLKDKIKVTTVIDTIILGEAKLPSQGEFRAQALEFIAPLGKFLIAHDSPLFVNLYPYKAMVNSEGTYPLEYALFKSPGTVFNDGDLEYQNLFDAMLDTLYWAFEKVGAGSLEIVVSETGWPTNGGGNATSLENQKSYVLNLIDHVKGTQGTPKKPGKSIETYIYSMFDESKRITPPDYEHFWGISSIELKYPINFD